MRCHVLSLVLAAATTTACATDGIDVGSLPARDFAGEGETVRLEAMLR